MKLLVTILYQLSDKMEIPKPYGSFHLFCCFGVLLMTILICRRFSDAPDKAERNLLMWTWGLLMVFEIYKQLLYAVRFTDPVTWKYQWESFPFQFCSSPLYILPIAALCKKEAIRDAARMFLASFSLFAGIGVMLIPNNAFSSFVGINLQTMIHHGAMVVIGVYLGGRLVREKKMTFTLFLRGGMIFFILLMIAQLLNYLLTPYAGESFNMFYISPYAVCPLAMFQQLYLRVPYLMFLMIYISGFTLSSFIIFNGQLFLRTSYYKSKKNA